MTGTTVSKGTRTSPTATTPSDPLASPEPTPLVALDAAGRRALFADARTAGSLTSAPVGDEELRGVWEMARWPPTSANTQPLRVLYVRTPQGRARLAADVDEGNLARVLAAPVVAVLARDLRFHEHIPTILPFKPELAQVLESDEERRTRMGSYSSALQAGYFILAVRAAGLAAGPMAGFDPAGVDEEFFPEGRWHAELLVTIGHPSTAPRPRLPRLPEQDVLRWA